MAKNTGKLTRKGESQSNRGSTLGGELNWICCLVCDEMGQALNNREKKIRPVTQMFTLTCSLHFSDGQSVTASLKANSKTENALVHYSGPVKRLPLVARKVTAVELRAYFKSFARELRAKYAEEEVDDRVVPPWQLDEALEYLVALGAKRRRSADSPAAKPHRPAR